MSEARLRFAPSPTGYLHIGGVRTVGSSHRLTLTEAEAEWSINYTQCSPGQSCSGDGSLTLDETQLFGLLWTFNQICR